MTGFDAWFSRLAGAPDQAPHDWQRRLAARSDPGTRVIRVPTGMGKTLGVVAAWSWHRLHERAEIWPRRLVWCLPMRVLVEQTEAVIAGALERVDLLWSGSGERRGRVGVHVLMGGVDAGSEWTLFPEECAVLIGTQDMLLSRALNRGYASGRARWPLEHGLVSHDALWVMDEVQLMDVGLATSAQLQAFHDEDAAKGHRPRHTWWMSATLQPDWLRSVDTEPRHGEWCRAPVAVAAQERERGLGAVSKALELARIAAPEDAAFARRVLEEHSRLDAGEHGRITLVVCNTVERACRTFDELKKLGRSEGLELVHSRFRPAERAGWRSRFLSREACTSSTDRIIVATQVVEAGVDVSAGCVITDLAPWSSLVQRFGRCARYGGEGRVVVVDRGRDDKHALPYAGHELSAAWAALEKLGKYGGAGIAAIERFEEAMNAETRRTLYPYAPKHLLLRRELDELFDTTADLTGADLDVSRFIRSGEERDLHVFWVDVPRDRAKASKNAPDRRRKPRREEMCAVPFLRARDWLCGEETSTKRRPRLRGGVRAWVWDWLDGAWVLAERGLLTPGRIVCVAADAGGYRLDRGFDPDAAAPVPEVPLKPLPRNVEAQAHADDSQDSDDLSVFPWKTIACHAAEVADTADAIANAVGLPADLRRVLVLAGCWHDYGKAHAAFQGAIGGADRPDRDDLAKAPDEAWLRPPGTYRTRDGKDTRPGLRHELASALALFAVLVRHAPRHPALLGLWGETLAVLGRPSPSQAETAPTPVEREVLDCSSEDFDLLAYLVASHHGKVRMALHATPKDQDYPHDGDGRGLPIRGVRDGDELPAVLLSADAPPVPPLRLSLEPATLGLSPITGRSWRERTSGLLDRFGPGALAWLEALLIAADRRASRLATADPLLSSETEGT